MAKQLRRKKIRGLYDKYKRQIRGVSRFQLAEGNGLTTSDLVNASFNSALWVWLEANEKDALKWSDDYLGSTFLALWKSKQRELFDHADPGRQDIERMGKAILSATIQVSQMAIDHAIPSPQALPTYPKAPFAPQPEPHAHPHKSTSGAAPAKRSGDMPSAAMVAVIIDCRDLSFVEGNCLALALDDCESDFSEDERIVSLTFEIITDSVRGVERWLLPRLKLTMLEHFHRAYPAYQIPRSARWNAVKSRILW